MNPGLVRKIIRESWLPTTLIAVAMFMFQLFVARFLPQFFDDRAGPLLEIPFKHRIPGPLHGDPSDSIATFH